MSRANVSKYRMSGSRSTRKVTVESSKKTSDSNAPRKSVFDRLGPGTVERPPPRREDYHESQSEKCRYWLRDGHCPFGSKCRYNHGSTSETKSKLKIIRSVVSKTDETVDGKGELRVKRFQNPDENPSDQSPKRSAKKHKSEKLRSAKEYVKEYVKEGNSYKEPREQRREKEEPKIEKKKEVNVRRSLSSSGWNLQPDQSESDEGTEGKELDWEERGALNYAREVALEERRNDLRRQIAKIDEDVEPVVTIQSKVDVPVVHSQVIRVDQDSHTTYTEETKPDKKKKTKSEKSKKKSKKKSHKSDGPDIQSEPLRTESESGDKVKKAKSPVVAKKKKRHERRNESDPEFLPSEVLPKEEYRRDVTHHDYPATKGGNDIPQTEIPKDQKIRARHSHEPRHEKASHYLHMPEQFEKRHEENLSRLDPEHDRKKQKVTRVVEGEKSGVGRSKEDRLKKRPIQLSPTYEEKDVRHRDEPVTDMKKYGPRSGNEEQREQKRRSKKSDKPKQTDMFSRPPDEEWNKVTKPDVRNDERRAKGPRTPSPELKHSSTYKHSSTDTQREPAVKIPRKTDIDTTGSSISSKNVSSDSSKEVSVPKQSKSPTEEWGTVERQADENSSVSSDSESSSSEESVACEVESVSGEEQRSEGVRSAYRGRDFQELGTEPSTPESKQQRRERREESAQNRDDYSEHVDRLPEEHRERSFNEPRERHADETERFSEYGRRDEKNERHHRERPREHRRPRDEEVERRFDHRGPKDTRETRDSRDVRDHRDAREHRDLPRMDHRDLRDRDRERDRERERYHEFGERDRHPPADIRRNDGPSKTRDYGERTGYGRGGWARDRHVRDRGGYASYDDRGHEYDERRTESRLPQDRNYDKDRGHPGRGARYREASDRRGSSWHERRVEKNYREPERERERERERFPENRERFHEDPRGSRPKRPRSSPEGSRNDRRGYREEQERRPCTPLEESEEWDYEEGHSPGMQIKEQPTTSRKRQKEHSPRSPHSEVPKRKKVASPEQDNPRPQEKISDELETKAIPSNENDKRLEKESERVRKDKPKKNKKRKLSDTEAETSENVDTPERKRKREAEQMNREKQVKKPKSKNQPEVVVRPWSDLENDEEDPQTQKKTENMTTESDMKEKTEDHEDGVDQNREGNQVFSDWSDASEDNVLNKIDSTESTEVKICEENEETEEKKDKESKVADGDGSVDDVYDPISDDEFEAMFAGDDDEVVTKTKPTPVSFDEVDWTILGSSTTKKESEPGDYIKRFSAGNIFSGIGLSSALAGPALTKLVQERCSQDAPNMKMKDLLAKSTGTKLTIGALIAAEARKMKERANVVNDIGPCRRALCARRDFYIRKQLRKLASTKLGTKLVLSNSSVEPVDGELFSMSVALYRRDKQEHKTEQEAQAALVTESSEVVVC